MSISENELFAHALQATKKVRQLAASRNDWKLMGCVGAALLTCSGTLFTGVNIHLMCGMGICAEYSAVAEMIKHGETGIDSIMATTSEGAILPPCGRCREMFYQINKANLEMKIFIGAGEKKLLHELLPFNWQNNFDTSLY